MAAEPDLYPAASRLAGQIAEADAVVVRDLLAIAGGDIFGALAALTQAIGTIIAERAEPETRAIVIGATGIAVARAAVLRAAAGRG
jgi:hypothetical protein